MPAMSKTHFWFCISLVAASAGFGGGWWAGRKQIPATVRTDAPASADPVAELIPVQSAASPVPAGKTAQAPGSALPAGVAALLKTLDPAGGLKSQSAILQYVSAMDGPAAKALAMSFEGKGYSADRNTSMLREAVFTRWAELDAEAVLRSARTSGDIYHRWNALSAGLNVLAQKDSTAAWERASAMGPLKEEAQRTLIASLSATNPEEAFALTSKMDGLYSNWAMESVMAAWVDRDPSAAGKAALDLAKGPMRSAAIGGLMERWAVTDYNGAAAFAASLSAPHERVAALSAALNSMARLKPEDTLAKLDGADVGSNRGQIIKAAIGSIAMRDFDSAMARVSSFTNYADKTGALSALAESASDGDRAKLLAMAATLPANLARSIYQGNIWQRMYSDPKGMAESVEKIPLAAVREQAINQAAQSLSYYQPDSAAELFGKLQSASQKPETAARIADRMADLNPEKAVEWAKTLGTEALKKSALSSAIQQWAGTDPEKAGQEIGKISNTETRAEVTRSVAKALAGRSLAEAERWVQTLSGQDRSSALGSVVEQAATQAPDRVESLYSSFATGLTPEAAARSENQAIARTVATQLAQTDATRAATWSLSLPEGGARDEAVSGVVSTWAAYDAVAASTWLHELPAGKGRDLAAGNLVNTIARDDPESAWAWATSIGDTARRREAAAAALSGWKANGDREAAQAALDAGGFGEEEYKELARKLE